MRPREIEKIAEGLMGALHQKSGVGTGCQGISDPEPFTCTDFSCSSGYDCGGAALFNCDNPQVGFQCPSQFFCDGLFQCPGSYSDSD